MLKETVRYVDFDDMPRQETLYFNLARNEMVDLLDLMPRLEQWQQKAQNEGPRTLETDEIREILDIIKILIEKSYGVRSADGKHFRKSPELFADFKDSAAYDEFVFSLFQDINKSFKFMTGILPTSMMDNPEVAAAMGEANKLFQETPGLNAPIPEVPAAAPVPAESVEVRGGQITDVQEVPMPDSVDEINATEANVPAWMREDRDPTPEEMRNMDREEMLLAFQRKTSQK